MVMVLRIAVVLLMLFLLPLVAVEGVAAVASPQVLSAGKLEFHGTLNGKP